MTVAALITLVVVESEWLSAHAVKQIAAIKVIPEISINPFLSLRT